jgi:hypothetical protein
MESDWCNSKELCHQIFEMGVSKNGIDIPSSFDVKAYIVKRNEMKM